MAERVTQRRAAARRRRRRLGLLAGAAVVVVGAGGGLAWAATTTSGSQYRLATATTGSVVQQVISAGTVSSVNQATVAFPISGKVASVPVRIGATVTAGQTVATLDATSLNEAVASAQSALAAAKQTLASDQAAESTTSATTSAFDSSQLAPHSAAAQPIMLISALYTSPGSVLSACQTAIAAVRSAQQQVAAAQSTQSDDVTALNKEVDTLGTDTTTLIADVTQLNADLDTLSDATKAFEADPTSADALAALQTAETAVSTDQGKMTAAQTAVTTDQKAVTAAQNAVSADQPKITALLDSANLAIATEAKACANVGSSGSGTGSGSTGTGSTGSGRTGGSGRTTTTPSSGSTGSRSISSGSTGSNTQPRNGSSSASSGASRSTGGSSGTGSSGAGGGSGSSTRTITAAQLAADQAQIDAANAQLAVAYQNREQATLASPIAGTVAAVGLSAGSDDGGSITIIGAGANEVSTTVPLANVDRVKVGQPVSVSVDGVTAPVTGKVAQIGIMNTTTGSATSYPVGILLNATSAKLYDGSGATVSITTDSVSNVLTVPSSAVHRIGAFSTVERYANGTVTAQRVTVGATGSDRTQIVSGLTAGDQVVLATVSEPLPTDSTSTSRLRIGGTSLTGGGGGLTGGGLTGGGFSGGGVGRR